MIRRIFYLLTIAVVMVSCKKNLSDAAELRVVALAYAIEHDVGIQAARTQWIFSLDCDQAATEVKDAFEGLFVERPKEVAHKSDMAMVDKSTGKPYGSWSVHLMSIEDDNAFVEVGTVKGHLNGYGQIFVLKKTKGHWYVISKHPSWVS